MRNYIGNSPHISDEHLIRFADGELPAQGVTETETHLRTCSKCRARLDELKHGADAYDLFHAQVLKPSLELPQEWSGVAARLRTLETPRKPVLPAPTMWWAAAAAALCCCVVVTWFLYRESPAQRMQQLLVRASAVPTPPHRRLQITANGHTWYRTAQNNERDIEATQALFIKAYYSWDDPLSPRSFAAWHRRLPSKRDHVFSIQDRNGAGRFYRLQTETPAGVLRVAALTLRADTLSPVKGAFHFEDQNDVTIVDAGDQPEPPSNLEPQNNSPLPSRPMLVKEVGPAEELRVLAALDAIGADVGESLSVDIAPSRQQIIVAGVGLSPDRQRQIRQALADIPNSDARFTSAQATDLAGQPPNTGTSPQTSNDAPLRQMLEQQSGGAQQFQAIADKSLDASSTLLQRAHALYVLAQKFPPSIASQFTQAEQDTLRSLRQRHIFAIEQAMAELKNALLPLLPASASDETQIQQTTSWDVGAAELYQGAKTLDASLGHILAGSYSQEDGQRIWNELPDDIRRLERLARLQEKAR